MELKLELGTNDLDHDLIEQFFIWKLKEIRRDIQNWNGYTHPDDKKQNKKIVKSCDVLLEYYGAT